MRVNAISFLFACYFGCCQWTAATLSLLHRAPRLQTALVCPPKIYAMNLFCKFLFCREDVPPAPVSHCCFWFCHGATKLTSVPAVPQALPLQQKRMFNTSFFPPDGRVGKWYSRNTAVHGVYSPGIDLPPISLLAFCISMFTSLPSVVPRCQSSHPAVVPSVCEVIVHNLWRLWYLLWEWPGSELG